MRRCKECYSRIRPPRPVAFLLVVTLIGTLAFSLVRLTIFLQNRELLATGIDNDAEWVMRAFGVGLRFDLNLTFMLMLPAAVVLIIGQLLGMINARYTRWATHISAWWLAISYSVALIIAIANIPYFGHFQTHLNAMSMKYATTGLGDVVALIFSETNYLISAIVAIIVAIGFSLLTFYLARCYKLFKDSQQTSSHRWLTIAILAVLSLLLLWADRGFYLRVRTLGAHDAIISNNSFINKLCINPVEPFIVSLTTSTDIVELMDAKKAHDIVIEEMHRDNRFETHIDAKPSPWRNVVILFEESFTAERLTREGSTEGLMPNLDRLVEEGLYFENTYSSGTHTCYGIYSLITSLPGFVDQHPLQDGLERPLGTIFEQLYRRGELKTLFYVTHGAHYDDVQTFLTTQGFERITSKNHYGVETDKMWGVDDHVMFDYALEQIDKEWSQGNAVAAVLLTCSNHSPYNPPLDAGFTPTSSEPEHMAIEYADWSMNRFLEAAREKEWFDETLFVITADHGRAIALDFEIPQSLNHVPLLFYSPAHIAPEVRSDLVSQMDITPTAISMLGLEYDNHTMGIDLNAESRRMIPFGHDGHIAARDHQWLYIYDVHNDLPYLYNLEAEGDRRLMNVANEHTERVEDMHAYTSAMIQAGWDLHNAHSVWSDATQQ